MKKFVTFKIGEVEAVGKSQTEARERALQIASELCTDATLTPVIIWGCPHQVEPIVVAARVGGYAVFRASPRRLPISMCNTRDRAICSAYAMVAQDALFNAISTAPNYGHFAVEIYKWLLAQANQVSGADCTTIHEAAAGFDRWAIWQVAYAEEKARGGDDATCRAAGDLACNMSRKPVLPDTDY